MCTRSNRARERENCELNKCESQTECNNMYDNVKKSRRCTENRKRRRERKKLPSVDGISLSSVYVTSTAQCINIYVAICSISVDAKVREMRLTQTISYRQRNRKLQSADESKVCRLQHKYTCARTTFTKCKIFNDIFT